MALLDYLRQKQKELQSGGEGEGGSRFLKLEDGENTVRILPGSEEDERFFVETKIHRVNVGGEIHNVHCLKMNGQPCPLCDLYFALWKQHNALGLPDKKANSMFSLAAKAIRPGDRFFMNVYSRATKEVKILSIGKKLMDKVVSDILELDANNIFMLDVKEGHDFKIDRAWNGEYPEYSKSGVKIMKSPLAGTAKEIVDILASRHDLSTLVEFKPLDEVRMLADQYRAAVTGSSVSTEGDSGGEEENEYLKNLQS